MDQAALPRVLVVDRDPHACRLVQQFLSDTYAVEIFSDGYVALDRVRSAPPIALITEILIAELDGLALCRLLKSDPLTRDVPILVSSILASSERAHNAGAGGFISKPFQRARLVDCVRGLIERRGARTSPHEGAP